GGLARRVPRRLGLSLQFGLDPGPRDRSEVPGHDEAGTHPARPADPPQIAEGYPVGHHHPPAPGVRRAEAIPDEFRVREPEPDVALTATHARARRIPPRPPHSPKRKAPDEPPDFEDRDRPGPPGGTGSGDGR